jgi:Flp pilus assembly protein TadG
MSVERMRRLRTSDSGAVAVETALAFTAVMSCVIVIVEFCLVVFTYSVYAEAARAGVRYATIHGSDSANCSGPNTGCIDPNATNVISQVVTFAKAFTAPVSGAVVQVSYPDSTGCSPPPRVIVTVTYTYGQIFVAPLKSLAFQVTSQGRIIY